MTRVLYSTPLGEKDEKNTIHRIVTHLILLSGCMAHLDLANAHTANSSARDTQQRAAEAGALLGVTTRIALYIGLERFRLIAACSPAQEAHLPIMRFAVRRCICSSHLAMEKGPLEDPY